MLVAGQKDHICTICEKAFVAARALRAHMIIHTGEKPHTCSDCKESFAYDSALLTHKKIHTRELSTDTNLLSN